MDTRHDCFVGFLLSRHDFVLLGKIAKDAGIDRYFLAQYVVRRFLWAEIRRRDGMLVKP